MVAGESGDDGTYASECILGHFLIEIKLRFRLARPFFVNKTWTIAEWFVVVGETCRLPLRWSATCSIETVRGLGLDVIILAQMLMYIDVVH